MSILNAYVEWVLAAPADSDERRARITTVAQEAFTAGCKAAMTAKESK